MWGAAPLACGAAELAAKAGLTDVPLLLMSTSSHSSLAAPSPPVHAPHTAALELSGPLSAAPALSGLALVLQLLRQLIAELKPPRLLVLTIGTQAVAAGASSAASPVGASMSNTGLNTARRKREKTKKRRKRVQIVEAKLMLFT